MNPSGRFPAWMTPRNVAQLGFCLGLAALCGVALLLSLSWEVPTGLFPWLAASAGLILALLQLAKLILAIVRGRSLSPADGEAEADFGLSSRYRVEDVESTTSVDPELTLSAYLWPFAFFVVLWLLGFEVGTFLVTVTYLLARHERIPMAVGMGTACVLVVVILFERLLHVTFPTGALFVFFN